jgi:hypothetical protein
MKYVALSLLAGWLASCGAASAQGKGSCLPDFTSLDVFQDSTVQSFSLPLKSRNVNGPFVTHATLDGKWDGTALALTFQFKFDGVSIPYNIYAVLVVSGGEVLAWRDLTKACTDPGASIFPGRSFALPPIQTSNIGKSDWHIIVWGQL